MLPPPASDHDTGPASECAAATPPPAAQAAIQTQAAPSPHVVLASPWPRSAQLALGLLIALTIGLIAWNAYGRSRWATRPTILDAARSDIFRIDLNRADRAQLLQLPGAGDSLVGRIEAYRREHGGFRDVDELRRVSGIGPVLLERWRTLVYVAAIEEGDSEDNDGNDAPMMPPPRVVRGARPEMEPAPVHSGGGKQPLKAGETIDVNKASVAELQRLPGVGPAMAARIVDTRGRKTFAAVDDLRRVSGIGPKTLDKLRPFIRVE